MTIDCTYDTLSKKTVAFHFPYVLLYPEVRQLYYLENRDQDHEKSNSTGCSSFGWC